MEIVKVITIVVMTTARSASMKMIEKLIKSE